APENFGTETIAGDTHDEHVVRALVEDELYRHPRIGATEYRGKRPLPRRGLATRLEPKIAWIDADDSLRGSAAALEAGEQLCDGAASRVEAFPRLRRVDRSRPRSDLDVVVPVSDFDDLHAPSLCFKAH